MMNYCVSEWIWFFYLFLFSPFLVLVVVGSVNDTFLWVYFVLCLDMDSSINLDDHCFNLEGVSSILFLQFLQVFTGYLLAGSVKKPEVFRYVSEMVQICYFFLYCIHQHVYLVQFYHHMFDMLKEGQYFRWMFRSTT